MGRVRPTLGTPFGVDGPWLAAILDTLGDIADLLDARLPAPASAGGGEPGPAGPVRVTEPAPAQKPSRKAVPVSEPAVDEPPTDDDEDVKPVKVSEPDPDVRPALPPPPPRRGKGSGIDVWQAFANLAKVTYPTDAGRDDIIAACVKGRIISAE